MSWFPMRKRPRKRELQPLSDEEKLKIRLEAEREVLGKQGVRAIDVHEKTILDRKLASSDDNDDGDNDDE